MCGRMPIFPSDGGLGTAHVEYCGVAAEGMLFRSPFACAWLSIRVYVAIHDSMFVAPPALCHVCIAAKLFRLVVYQQEVRTVIRLPTSYGLFYPVLEP